jgi:hypothetical protein
VAAALCVGAAGAQSSDGLAGTHPWHHLLPTTTVTDHLPPLTVSQADALDVSATLRGVPGEGELALSLRARYRLDAEDYLRRKRADADDLDALHGAIRTLAQRDAALAWFATRCEGVWRAWQVELLGKRPTVAPHDPERAYRAALRDLLARTATSPAEPHDVAACRLERWAATLTLDPEAPDLVAARSEAGLARRAAGLASSVAPASVWVEADARGSAHARGSLSLRAGLDLPLTSGSSVALGLGRFGPDVALSWHRASVDGRIMARHHGDAAGGVRADAERPERVERHRAEAALARADASRRWSGACGDTAPAAVIACLERAAGGAALRDDLLGAIEAELAALQAELALVSAAGRDLRELLRRGPAAPLP